MEVDEDFGREVVGIQIRIRKCSDNKYKYAEHTFRIRYICLFLLLLPSNSLVIQLTLGLVSFPCLVSLKRHLLGPLIPTTSLHVIAPCRRRLIRDFKKLSADPPQGISGAPCNDNLMLWNAVIFGPGSACMFPILKDVNLTYQPLAETPFEDGTFKLLLTFEESYPNKPPTVKFLSRMFHPNVYANGELCLDILQNRWSPTYDVAAILTSIQSLLHDPNPNRYTLFQH